jgi:hypothetical protein
VCIDLLDHLLVLRSDEVKVGGNIVHAIIASDDHQRLFQRCSAFTQRLHEKSFPMLMIVDRLMILDRHFEEAVL